MQTPYAPRRRPPQTQQRGFRAAAASAFLIVALHGLLASCSSWDNVADLPRRNGVTDPIRDADLGARAPERTDSRFDSVICKYRGPLFYPAPVSVPPPAARARATAVADLRSAGEGGAGSGASGPGVNSPAAG